MKEHKKISPQDISCVVITLSDSKYKEYLETNNNYIKSDASGKYISEKIKEKYILKNKLIIPDEKDILIKTIDSIIEDVDVIFTTGGTGLESRDITIETVEKLFDKEIKGFGEIFRLKSYKELGSGALLSRATAGVYKSSIIISMPGSPNAVKTGTKIIINELPHLVNHAKK